MNGKDFTAGFVAGLFTPVILVCIRDGDLGAAFLFGVVGCMIILWILLPDGPEENT
jgi:hypothetical protein